MTDQNKSNSHTGDHGDTSAEKRSEKFGDRTVGRGMNSPDSTEVVLDAKTGEPDPRATEKRAEAAGSKSK